MSVEEVEKVLLYSLENSVSPNEQKRTEAIKLIKELEGKIENAGPLFQLLLKYQLTQESVSMTIIRILESHLTIVNGEGIVVASPIASQLRAAFVSEFLGNILLSNPKQSIKQFLKNAVCKFLLTAFIHERLAGTWPDALPKLFDLLGESAMGREIFLKFCLILTEEISSCNVVKNEIINRRDADLRDSMRVNDNAMLCSFWRGILQDHSRDFTIVVMALECLAAFSSWIDVGLVVEGETLKLIYFLLQSQRETVQLAAADCLSEIVLKGMSAGDKISLANYMNLTSIFDAVIQRGVIDSFFSKICKVLNNLGYSLGQQINLTTPNMVQSVQTEVVQYVCPVLLPHLLQFMRLLARGKRSGDDCWEDSLVALLPFIGNVFEISRSMRDHLRSDQIEFMGQFLPICIDLLQVSDEEVIENLQEEDGDGGLVNIGLIQAFESVLWLQGHATLAFLNSLTREEPLSLGRCELIAKLTLRIPEGMRGPPSFTLSINGNNQMTPVGELVTWTIEKIPERYPGLLYIVSQVLVRYSSTSYLDVFPNKIELGLGLLMRLLETRNFQAGDCENLLRFVKNLKGKLSGYATDLLTALQGPMNLPGLSCEIYEVAGLAVAALDPRSVQLKVITSSLLQKALENSMRLDQQLEMAKGSLDCISSFAKGFMSDSCLDPGEVRAWFTEYSNGFLISHTGVMSPEYLSSLVNYTQRMIPLMQGDSISLVQSVCREIITGKEMNLDLMSQLLPLISAALFKLREQFANAQVLGQLWPLLIPRIDLLLRRPVQGTDDLLHHLTLQKAFLSVLHAMSTSASGANFSLAQRNILIEGLLLRVAEGFGGAVASVDAIALLRSFCGVLNRCQTFLSSEFINRTILPILLHRSLPDIYKSLDASSKKSQASLPAAFLNLLQDFLSMLRGLQQQGNLSNEWIRWNGIDLVGAGDVKESRTALVNHFLYK